MEGWALAYEVTARKWRPQEFDGVIGQEHVTTTLKNAIQAGQIAHAYLFAGPRGVGKTTTARILAKALNCVDGPTVTPCNACTFCREISEGRSVDVLEIDGASNNRVEQVRTHLLESVKYTPSQGKHKIYIIDEVHMLTKEAFNALLKTLEEPPAHVYFVFATTDPRKVIPTVLSRCQRFDFRRISGPTIVDHLAMISEKSGYDVQREALALIARRVDGSMRDAESLLDQVVAFGGTALTAREAAEVLGIVDQDVYFELLDIVAEQDVPKGLDLVDRIFGQGPRSRRDCPWHPRTPAQPARRQGGTRSGSADRRCRPRVGPLPGTDRKIRDGRPDPAFPAGDADGTVGKDQRASPGAARDRRRPHDTHGPIGSTDRRHGPIVRNGKPSGNGRRG